MGTVCRLQFAWKGNAQRFVNAFLCFLFNFRFSFIIRFFFCIQHEKAIQRRVCLCVCVWFVLIRKVHFYNAHTLWYSNTIQHSLESQCLRLYHDIIKLFISGTEKGNKTNISHLKSTFAPFTFRSFQWPFNSIAILSYRSNLQLCKCMHKFSALIIIMPRLQDVQQMLSHSA